MEEAKTFELDKSNVLGKGSFGVVYKGNHNSKDNTEEVAFKKIPQEILRDNIKLQSLVNEISISGTINQDDNEKDNKYSSNIVRFIDIADIDNDKYLVYEFCNGGDLKRYLRYFRKFNETMIQNIMTQIIKGLQVLHNKKIVHHDLKPENILVQLCPNKLTLEDNLKKINAIMEITDPKNKYLNKEDKALDNKEILQILSQSKMKLSDFGLSKCKEEFEYNKEEVSGSPLYIDPILFKPESDKTTIDDEKVDIWALGIIAYELFFYDLPFQPFPPSIERLKKAFEKGEYIIDFKQCENGQISKQFLSFLNCCLQLDRNIRPLTDELLEHEFITRDPQYFTYMTIDNYKNAKYPKGDYLKTEGKITMNINDNRNINAFFDWEDNVK